MARKKKRAAPTAGDPNDPEGLLVWMRRYLSWLAIRNYAARTIETREGYLLLFIAWAEARGLSRPVEVTRPILERYQRHVYHLRTKHGRALSFRSQHSRLVPIRAFFKWLTREGVLLHNPASELELPKLGRRLPRQVLSAAEVEQVIHLPDTTEALGLRDRAILETLYSTAMRRAELTALELWDVDAERGTVMIREGKGGRDRMVPIGARALLWIDRYLETVRPELVVPPESGRLFLSSLGEGLSPNRLTHLVRGYIDRAALGKHGACHLLRHTTATLMHENGADIRFIQELLGHVELTTTQIYTQVSIRKLKEIHAATHPAANLPSREEAAGDELVEAEVAPTLDEVLGTLDDDDDREGDDRDGGEG
jgi:integrase/recombinase XerD